MLAAAALLQRHGFSATIILPNSVHTQVSNLPTMSRLDLQADQPERKEVLPQGACKITDGCGIDALRYSRASKHYIESPVCHPGSPGVIPSPRSRLAGMSVCGGFREWCSVLNCERPSFGQLRELHKGRHWHFQRALPIACTAQFLVQVRLTRCRAVLLVSAPNGVQGFDGVLNGVFTTRVNDGCSMVSDETIADDHVTRSSLFVRCTVVVYYFIIAGHNMVWYGWPSKNNWRGVLWKVAQGLSTIADGTYKTVGMGGTQYIPKSYVKSFSRCCVQVKASGNMCEQIKDQELHLSSNGAIQPSLEPGIAKWRPQICNGWPSATFRYG
eukprot:scaffold36418_cov191-Amphora_coffeaeformis.AAC.4